MLEIHKRHEIPASRPASQPASIESWNRAIRSSNRRVLETSAAEAVACKKLMPEACVRQAVGFTEPWVIFMVAVANNPRLFVNFSKEVQKSLKPKTLDIPRAQGVTVRERMMERKQKHVLRHCAETPLAVCQPHRRCLIPHALDRIGHPSFCPTLTLRDHPDKLRDHPCLVQGWESVC